MGDEPFAVMLGDDIIDAPVPCMKQMIDVFERHGRPVIAVQQVPRDEISAYGVIDGIARAATATASTASATWSRSRRADEAPRDLAIIGRYILTPDIFEALEKHAARQGAARSSSRTASAP